MKIVFQSINLVSALPAMGLALFVRTYYLKIEEGICRDPVILRIYKLFGLKPLPLEDAKSLKGYKYFVCGHENNVYKHSERMAGSRVLEGWEHYYPNVKDLNIKLGITLATSFNYLEMGQVALFVNAENIREKIVFVHTKIISYMYQGSGVPEADDFVHILFPASDIQHTLSMLSRKLKKFHPKIFSHGDELLSTETYSNDKCEQTAIFFHQSFNYSKLFTKGHYFSPHVESPLNLRRVTCFVIGRVDNDRVAVNGSTKPLIEIQRIQHWDDWLQCLWCFCQKVIGLKSKLQIYSAVMLVANLYAYLGWYRAVKKYPFINNAIIDYDILFPKMLSLALESHGIKTLALQERGHLAFDCMYGTIVDTYLMAGGIFTEYSKKNKSIKCNHIVDFGQWRSTFFYADKLVKFEDLSFISYGVKKIQEYERFISVLGWFTDFENSSTSPILSIKATKYFYTMVKNIAKIFPSYAFILRMKLLSKNDLTMIGDEFVGLSNVFLCDDYSVDAVSYSICMKSDIVISVPSSLA